MFVMFLQDNMVSLKKKILMKNLKFILIFFVFATIATIQMSFTRTNFSKKAIIEVAKISHDFGKIPQGKPVVAEFIVKNTGEAPLMISTIQTSCGCTAADFTKTPIAPNKTGFVKISYNASSLGSFIKTATIISNADNSSLLLTLQGEVE